MANIILSTNGYLSKIKLLESNTIFDLYNLINLDLKIPYVLDKTYYLNLNFPYLTFQSNTISKSLYFNKFETITKSYNIPMVELINYFENQIQLPFLSLSHHTKLINFITKFSQSKLLLSQIKIILFNNFTIPLLKFPYLIFNTKQIQFNLSSKLYLINVIQISNKYLLSNTFEKSINLYYSMIKTKILNTFFKINKNRKLTISFGVELLLESEQSFSHLIYQYKTFTSEIFSSQSDQYIGVQLLILTKNCQDTEFEVQNVGHLKIYLYSVFQNEISDTPFFYYEVYPRLENYVHFIHNVPTYTIDGFVVKVKNMGMYKRDKRSLLEITKSGEPLQQKVKILKLN